LKWIIQNNLSTSCSNQLIVACEKTGITFETIKVIPFDETLPNISTKEPVIFYGGTNFVTNIWKSGLWKPGVFFDAENFTFSSYQKNWDVLNSEAKILPLKDVYKENIDPDNFIFLRPNKDLKEFAGEVIKFKELLSWVNKVSFGEYLINENCEVVLSEPYAIKDEWRLFVVNKKIVTGSHYRTYGRLNVNKNLPNDVLSFTKKQIENWCPSYIFTIDVGRCGNELYVIEANCFNSSGFYESDVGMLVTSVTNFCTSNFY
jgi:hypothetical protein